MVGLRNQDDLRQEAPGHIERIEVTDFKSYRGRQVIGPFKKFTAVIGPNGSGKSNLMDAISFVLGVRTAHLRGSLKELLYKGGRDDPSAAPTRGSVKLIYVTGAHRVMLPCCNSGRTCGKSAFDPCCLHCDTGDGDEIEFSRGIVPSGSADSYQSQYKIDNRTVSWDAYNNKLKSFGILVKARNFLVFQVPSSCTLLLCAAYTLCCQHSDAVDMCIDMSTSLRPHCAQTAMYCSGLQAHIDACACRATSSRWRP